MKITVWIATAWNSGLQQVLHGGDVNVGATYAHQADLLVCREDLVQPFFTGGDFLCQVFLAALNGLRTMGECDVLPQVEKQALAYVLGPGLVQEALPELVLPAQVVEEIQAKDFVVKQVGGNLRF